MIIKGYNPRHILPSDQWILTSSFLSIAGGILLLTVHYAFVSGQMVIDLIPWNTHGLSLPGGRLIPGPLFYQQIVNMWTYAGIIAVVAGVVSISLVVKSRVLVVAGVISALVVACLLTLAGISSLNGSDLMISPAYFSWFPTVAIGVMIGAFVSLWFRIKRGLSS